MAKRLPMTITDVLCDSGRGGEVELAPVLGEPRFAVIDRAARALDKAYLTNVLVLRGSDKKYYVGEFTFRFRKVSKSEAERVARNFDPNK